jgi:hypothetical protein
MSPKGDTIKVTLVGLGMPAAGTNAWIYVYGTFDGVEGLYVSESAGSSWIQIGTDGITMGDGPAVLEGSRQNVGRVYLGTGGRGIFRIDFIPPKAPANLIATGGNDQVMLSWNVMTNADSYNVKRSIASGREVTITNLTTTSCVDAGLTAGKTYYYQVSALNTAGESANSSEINATVNVPPTPTILQPAFTGTNLSVSISSQSGFSYILEATPEIAPPNWAGIQTNMGGGLLTFVVPITPACRQQFLRIRVQ